MNTQSFEQYPTIDPDFSRFDTPEEMYRDAVKWGFVEDLRRLIDRESAVPHTDPVQIIRDFLYELAAAEDRDLAVDLLLHLTGIAEFGPSSLRDYGRKHGCTHEWFRRQAEAMRTRLGLPPLPSQRSDEVRAEYRLVNRRNGGA